MMHTRRGMSAHNNVYTSWKTCTCKWCTRAGMCTFIVDKGKVVCDGGEGGAREARQGTNGLMLSVTGMVTGVREWKSDWSGDWNGDWKSD